MTINNYSDYKVEDFVEDEHFRKWVFEQDKPLDFFWQAVLRKFPEKEIIIEEARQLLLDTHNFFHQEIEKLDLPNENFNTILKETFEEETIKIQAKPPSKLVFLSKLAAACMLFLVSLSFCYYFYTNSENRIEYMTSNGQWELITLPDGSKVELNANSRLTLINEWKEGEDRTVWLKGEAFFKVEKKEVTNAKFTVITKDLKVAVLGTAFSVNTRNQHTEVFLEEGKITLELDDKQEEIEPGEFISYSQEKKKMIERYKKTEEIHSNWKNGVLTINDASMKEIIDEIERIYGVDLIVNNQELLKREGPTIAVPVDNLDMATAILERLLNVKVEKRGEQLFIN